MSVDAKWEQIGIIAVVIPAQWNPETGCANGKKGGRKSMNSYLAKKTNVAFYIRVRNIPLRIIEKYKPERRNDKIFNVLSRTYD